MNLGDFLSEIREDLNLSQSSLAGRMNKLPGGQITQGRVSSIESSDSISLSTLRRYLSAIGGKSSIVVKVSIFDYTLDLESPG